MSKAFTPRVVEGLRGQIQQMVDGLLVALAGAASRTTTTDSGGNYIIPGLVDGAYTLTPAKVGCTFSPVSRTPTIAGANVTKNFAATCAFSISGQVTTGTAGLASPS